VDLNLKVKLQESIERSRKREKNKEAEAKQLPNKGFFGKGIGKIKNLMQSKESKLFQEYSKH